MTEAVPGHGTRTKGYDDVTCSTDRVAGRDGNLGVRRYVGTSALNVREMRPM